MIHISQIDFSNSITKAEQIVLDISIKLANNSPDKSFSLTDVVHPYNDARGVSNEPQYDKYNRKKPEKGRMSVNRLLYFIELKTNASKTWRLKRHEKVGRGQKAIFYWEDVSV